VAAIVAARHERRTAWAIATRLHVPRSTVAAILVRVGLNRLAHLNPPLVVHRYDRTRPGELVHLDIKTPRAHPTRGATAFTPTRRSSVGAGWEYVHVAVDDYSRAAYVEVLAEPTGRSVAGFLRCTVAMAGRCRVRLSRTRPYRPQTNGKAERFIQTLIRGWAYAVSLPVPGVGRSR
jgi:transposase InsO family protein